MSDGEGGSAVADKKRRGRPKKPETETKPAVKRKASSSDGSVAKKPRGRPKGSKKRGRKPKAKKVEKSEADGQE